MLKTKKGISEKVINKAKGLIKDVENGILKANRLKKPNALVICIGKGYRIIKFPKREYWYLCAHSEYNKLITHASRG